MTAIRRSCRTPPVPQERRPAPRRRPVLALAGIGALVGMLPVVPGGARRPAGAAEPAAPAVFAAGAEAWAYSVEIGVPGPLGPLASHTTAAVDNSPHAQGASGLADPGYLVRAAAGLIAGVPTPAYCESAWPEGPDHTDCGAPGGQPVATSGTHSGAGPDASATAALADVSVPAGAGPAGGVTAGTAALTVAAQSTTSSAFLAPGGVLHATADVTLTGVAVAGGALRIGTLTVHRDAATTGLADGAQTATGIELGGVTVGGKAVDPGADPVRSLAAAAKQAFGDTVVVEGLSGRQQQTEDGKLAADSSGLRITWRPQPDRSVQIVLGYGRVFVYATGPLAGPAGPGLPGGDVTGPAAPPAGPGAPGTSPAEGGSDPARGTGPTEGGSGPLEGGAGPAPSPFDGGAFGAPGAPDPQSGSRTAAGATFPGGATGASLGGGGSAAGRPASETPASGSSEGVAPAVLVPGGRPLTFAPRPPVQWVSPFLVLAQMTTGRQTWWFLLGLVPLLAAGWLARRSGLGLVAPWAAGGGRGEPS